MSKIHHIKTQEERKKFMSFLACQFDQKINRSDKPVFIVKFSMDRCGPCLAMEPLYEKLATNTALKKKGIYFFSIHSPFKYEDLWETLLHYGIISDDDGYPTVYLHDPRAKVCGLKTSTFSQIESFVDSHKHTTVDRL